MHESLDNINTNVIIASKKIYEVGNLLFKAIYRYSYHGNRHSGDFDDMVNMFHNEDYKKHYVPKIPQSYDQEKIRNLIKLCKKRGELSWYPVGLGNDSESQERLKILKGEKK